MTIDSLEEALEAAQQYYDLGLPMPVDLTASLEDMGITIKDDTYLSSDELQQLKMTIEGAAHG